MKDVYVLIQRLEAKLEARIKKLEEKVKTIKPKGGGPGEPRKKISPQGGGPGEPR